MQPISRRQLLDRSAKAGLIATAAGLPIWRGLNGTDALAGRKRDLAMPRGRHLSFTGPSDTTATATWFTDGAADPGSVVQYGPVERGMSRRDIRFETFPESTEGSSRPTPGVDVLTHESQMTGLDPGGKVRYRVGRPGAWSDVRTFSTAPASRKFTFALLGDVGTARAARRNIKFLRSRKPDLVLVAGDLSYANGDQPIWDRWFGMFESVGKRIPVMAAPGNHENKDFGGETYKVRLSHPGDQAYYSFEYANVAFVISTGGVFLEDGTIAAELAQLELMLADAALRRATGEIDFIAFMQHYPLWTDHHDRGPFNPALVVTQEHILQRYGVDLLLTGHDHFYERSLPMVYGQPAGAGYVQVIAGGGGQSLYEFVPESSFQTWSASHAMRHHVVLFEVEGGRMDARAVATDGDRPRVIDRFSLDRRSAAAGSAAAPRGLEAVVADLPGPLQEGVKLSKRQADRYRPRHAPHRH